jgi:hypothetical protein
MVLFGYIYPGERSVLPVQLLRELSDRFWNETESIPQDDRVCHGTMLSREQYLIDVNKWGYADARLKPRGSISAAHLAHWTAAIGNDAPAPPPDAPRFDTVGAD